MRSTHPVQRTGPEQGAQQPSQTLQLEDRVVQRNNGDGEEEEGEGEQDLPGAVGNVATVVGAATGDTGLGAAMGTIAEFAEGAGGAQEALDSGADIVSRVTGAAMALNTVAGIVGRGVPIVGQVANATRLAQSVIAKIPAARSEASEARSDLADPDLEMGRTPEERARRVEDAEGAQNEAEAASFLGRSAAR